MSKTENISIGNCGEYFVAAELERNGFTVAIPMSNTKNFDILAINKENNEQFAIQVKTNHTNAKTWTLSQKNEILVDENIYYVFVSLNYKEFPEYYIIPSLSVAKSINKSHSDWLCGTTKTGKKRNDTQIRKFSFDISQYNPYNLNADDYRANWNRIGKKYYDLTKFLPFLDKDYFGEWYIDKNADGTYENPFHFPCLSYTQEIEDFASSVRVFIDDHPELNLEKYQKILNENGIEIETIKKTDISKCNAQCICAMIVANVLAEKFCEGAILGSCKDKTFVKWLKRLQEIDAG